ncbi:Phosphatidylinositol-4-phosphate-5-kinase [Globisporangium polare]
MEATSSKPPEDEAAAPAPPQMHQFGSADSYSSQMNVRELQGSTVSLDSNDDNPLNASRNNSREDGSDSPAATPASVTGGTRRTSITVSRQNSLGSTGGPRHGYSKRVKKPRPLSGSSATGSSVFDARGSMLSRMSSTTGGGLRDTFFGTRREDPLELSTSQEFDLTVIDESGGMEENIVGQILSPDVGDYRSWSSEGYAVVAIGAFTLVVTASLAVAIPKLDGYTIDPGLVFGSLQTLILCSIVFVVYHGVQSFQAHPNPLILYKCVIDMMLALRFLLDPLLQNWGVYLPGFSNKGSCKYLSGVTQFLYLSSDCWYFALIVDLYTSLTNPFTSVSADRRKYKIAIYAIGALSGFMTIVIPGAHGFSDGAYCWTNRGNSQERNFFRLNVASWLLFYDWMIVFYISGIAVLVFCAKRLRSGLRDTLQTRRDMLRNGAISIMSFTAYWTIVFTWYAVSFHTRTHYEADGTMSPSRIFRSYAYSLSGRGAVNYFVWFMLNRPSMIRENWLKFSSDSADKKFSAQLNTALQHELIYFTIEGMTRAIQMADDELIFSRDHSPVPQDLVGSPDSFRMRESSNPPVLGGQGDEQMSEFSARGGNLQESPVGSTASGRAGKSKKKKPVKGDSGTFEIPRVVPPTAKKKGPGVPPAALSPATLGGPSPSRKKSSASYNHIRFTPYMPDAFAELRSAYGISSSDFLESFQTSTKPNISEGASGAFMFFSGDRKFIVKSMAEAECRFLCEIAENYVEFLIANPSSLITKFFGCFKITLYEKKFYFIVMENLFDVANEGVQIHHRFDIKGSWVNRSYKRPRRGAKVKCRHCSMQFKSGAKKSSIQCPNVVGLHEPNVVLKDNDLRTRMRIGKQAGQELYELLREDSFFLCRLGIMDYSLLLGVVDIEFMVDQPAANSRRNTATSANPDGTNESFMTTASSGSFVDTGVADLQSAKSALQQHLTQASLARDRNDSDINSTGHSVRSLAHMGLASDSNGNPHAHSHQRLPRAKKSMRRSKRIFGPGYYYVGVIDILQTWTLKKRLERFFKVHVQRRDSEGLSAIEPELYQKRFEAKLREVIALPKEYQAALNRKDRNVGGANMLAPGTGAPAPGAAAGGHDSVATTGRGPMRSASSHEIPMEYDEDEVDIDVLIETGGRSGRGGARGGRMTIDEVESSDNSRTNSSSATEDLEDLEQAQRNPEPILLRFSQMLVGSSTRSNITTVSSQRDAL